MKLSDFDYDLPEERIAQRPLADRDASRLLLLPRIEGAPSHHRFADLPRLLRPGDLLVCNDTRVFPARLVGWKVATGGRVEALLLEPHASGCWRALCGASKPIRVGARLAFGESSGALVAEVEAAEGEGVFRLRFDASPDAILRALEAGLGEVPLPPYIRRQRAGEEDRERYQTIYARVPGAVAAPTAGLHFTASLFRALAETGVARTFVTLHVGPGTFLPIRTETLEAHTMHEEAYEIPAEAARAIRACKARGGRVVCVGTTALRAVEAAAARSVDGTLPVGRARTRLFIRPGFEPRVADGLITNFHLPRSTLLVLVAALAGRERVLAAYREAITRGYRFYSYGDAMLIL